MFKKLIHFLKSSIEMSDKYLTFGKVGQIYAVGRKLIIYGFNKTDLEVGAGGNVVINAGGDTLELKVGNRTAIKITRDRVDIITENLYVNDNKIN